MPTHNKDVEMQAEKRSSGTRIEPVGFVAQGWTQAVWREGVLAGRSCRSTRIDTGMEAGSHSRQECSVQDGSDSRHNLALV